MIEKEMEKLKPGDVIRQEHNGQKADIMWVVVWTNWKQKWGRCRLDSVHMCQVEGTGHMSHRYPVSKLLPRANLGTYEVVEESTLLALGLMDFISQKRKELRGTRDNV